MSSHMSSELVITICVIVIASVCAPITNASSISPIDNAQVKESSKIDWKGRIGIQKVGLHERDEYMKTNELIERLGYPSEVHNVTTDDNFILEIFRIPPIRPGTQVRTPPVLLQHGLLASSDCWVINFENESLGFMLADAGFDVWISNVRGNRYGQGHVTPTPSKHDFYQFSWDEMAAHDLPSVIDYVLNETGYKDLQYIGHSMGTTIGFAMLSTKTEYNSKIRHFHALAPVAMMDSVRCKLKYLAPFVDEIQVILDLIGADDFLPSNAFIKELAHDCNSTWRDVCADIIYLLCGYDPQELNMTRLPIYLAHTPAGTSAMTVAHYAQEINSGYFRHYDYGLFKNWMRYGRFTPPEYDLTNIVAPVTLFWSANDLLADPDDVDRLYRGLPNCVDKLQVGGEHFSHFDFVWGTNVAPLLNDFLIDQLERY